MTRYCACIVSLCVMLPAWCAETKLIDKDGQPYNQFGGAVAISQTTAVVGSPFSDFGDLTFPGAAIIYTFDGTNWTPRETLLPPDVPASSGFGSAIAMDDDTILIGAPNDDAAHGAVYAFAKVDSTWVFQQKLTAMEGLPGDRFGASVALDGATAVIGAPLRTVHDNSRQGAIYIFNESAVWKQDGSELYADDGVPFDTFGASVALKGSSIFVGSPVSNVGGLDAAGAVYAFSNSNGPWIQQQKLTASTPATNASFGASVALQGTSGFAGASGVAAVTVFEFGGGGWTETQVLSPTGAEASANFGAAMFANENLLLIGSPAESFGTNTSQGVVYLFESDRGTWSQSDRFSSSDGAIGDAFGTAVGMSGVNVLVGAYLADGDSGIDQGAAYVYSLNINLPPAITSTAPWATTEGVQGTLQLSAADVNGNAFEFSLVSGPAGLTISSTGLVDFTPADGLATLSATVQVTETDGSPTNLSSSATFAINVQVSPPSATLSGAGTLPEGGLYSVTVENVTDAGQDTISDGTIDWGDGTTTPYTAPGSYTHKYQDGSPTGTSYPITLSLTDEDGTFTAATSAVIVSDVAPTVLLTGAATANEGTAYNLTVSQPVDPGNDTLSSATIFWGDGQSTAIATSGTYTHTYANGGATGTPRSIRIDLVNEDGSFPSAGTKDITVNNVAPTVSLNGPASIDEGATYSLVIGPIVDPGTDTVSSATLNWGDGQSQNLPATAAGTYTHVYAHAVAGSTRTISVDLADNDGMYVAAATLNVSIIELLPTASISGANTIDEAATYSLTVSGPQGPNSNLVIGAVIHWGDGQTQNLNLPIAGTYTHTYADGSAAGISRTIVLDLVDGNGTRPNIDDLTLSVHNVDPTGSISGAASLNEGGVFTLTVNPLIDPGTDTISSGTITWGDGATTPFTGPKSYTHTYADDGDFTVELSVTDEDGSYDIDTLDVTVDNVDPVISISGAASIMVNTSYTLTVSGLVDPGADTISSGIINWGDSTTSPYAGVGPYTHTFTSGGTVTITISLTDEDGTYAGIDTLEVTVQIPINHAPVATSGTLAVLGTTPGTGFMSATDSDPDTTLSFFIVTQPGKGTVTVIDAASGEYLYQANAGASGQDTFTFKATDGDLESNQAQVTITITSPNASPVISSAASATPSSGTTDDTFTFSVAATDSDGDTLTYSWDFGDSTSGSGATVTKNYSAAGSYTANVTVSDGHGGTATSSVPVTVTAIVYNPLVVTKLNVKLNFAKPNLDSIAFSGTLPLADGTNFSEVHVQIDVGGVKKDFTLTSKGSVKTATDSVTFGKPKKGVSKYSVKFQKGSFAAQLADEGLLNEDAKGKSTPIVVTLTFGADHYRKTQPQLYTAKRGKSGATK